MRIELTLAYVALLSGTAAAQLPTTFVTDATNDAVYRCSDLNGDGDYNDANEVVPVYRDTVGSIVLGNNIGLARGVDGTIAVSDTSEDSVILFRDFNGDGDFEDDGEYWRFFDGRPGGNASGLLMIAANGIVYQPSTGAWWVASANTAVGSDHILRLVDLNGDGDANDAGEALEYWIAPGGVTGDYIPQAVAVAPGGAVYYLDVGSTGAIQKGVYRIIDANNDGDALDPGDGPVPFFLPPTGAATSFFWCLELAADGWFYTADTGNEIVWRFKDLNGDGDAHDAGEFSAWWTVGAPSNIWDVWAADDGSLYLSDSQTNHRLTRLFDTNANGVINPGESVEVYDELISPVAIGNGRGIDRAPTPAAGTGICFGDGTAAACPCGNFGTAGKGCANSIFASGARLETQGAASVAGDTLALVGTRMPNSSALYFQGTLAMGGGSGVAFGDGLRCAGGSVIRLGTKANANGSSRYPVAGDLSVSVRGAVNAGDVRVYQIWYRNADPVFCNPETFNLSNGVQVNWTP